MFSVLLHVLDGNYDIALHVISVTSRNAVSRAPVRAHALPEGQVERIVVVLAKAKASIVVLNAHVVLQRNLVEIRYNCCVIYEYSCCSHN